LVDSLSCWEQRVVEVYFESKVTLVEAAPERGGEAIPVNQVHNELGPLEMNTVLEEELVVSK
jgi:hypothetical protein